MKKTLIGLFLLCIIFTTQSMAQCATVTAELQEPWPQSGPHNYFGVKVSIASSYWENITVEGYIYDDGDYNTDHPFTLVIAAGNTYAETGITYYQTGPASGGAFSITSISPCPPTLVLADYKAPKLKDEAKPIALTAAQPSYAWSE